MVCLYVRTYVQCHTYAPFVRANVSVICKNVCYKSGSFQCLKTAHSTYYC